MFSSWYFLRILAAFLDAGKFRVEEIEKFDQDDLNVDDAMVLDAGDEVYVWVGDGAEEEEKDKAFEMAAVSTLSTFRRSITNLVLR
jgi:hypothetical protein